MIYCGYQGCGKTTYCKAHPDTAIDLDSSNFAKTSHWYKDYVTMARVYELQGYNVFISAHKEVINYLLEQHLPFELLIPAQNKIAWRHRLEFRYNINPTRGNMNAIYDFDKNFDEDMAFYRSLLGVKIHEVTARIVTDIGDFVG